MAGKEGAEPIVKSDKELTIAFQHGDDGAFDAIYARHYDRVRATCRRLLGCSSEAEEATQETFLRCYRSLGRFNGQYQLGAWVARIATNVCVDMLRQRARTLQLAGITVEEIDLEADVKAIDLRVEDALQLSETLGEIQPLHAEALYLRAVEGLSHEEMARRLAMTPQQVKSLLHRSRSSFRKVWENVSGWAAAPLVGFRAFMGERSRETTAAGHGAMLTTPGSTLLAEKVAVGAVAMVVAFSPVPSSTEREPSTGRSSTPRHAAEEKRAAATAGVALAPQRERAEDKSGPSPADALVAKVLDEAERARRKLEKTARTRPPEEPEDDPVPGNDPNAGAANKEVRKVVREAKEKLGDLP